MNSPFRRGECRRVLLVGSNHVGNNIFCTPAIGLLKRNFPDIEFDALSTSRRGADAFKGNPDITRVRYAVGKRHVRWIAKDYDFVIGVHRDVSRKCLRGFKGPHAIVEPDLELHRADQLLEFVSALAGVEITAADRNYKIGWDESHADRIRNSLGELENGHFRVGLHVGCGRTGVHGWKFWYPGRDRDPKLWPLEKYIELARALQRAEPRIQFVITGSTNERFLARRFLAAVPGTVSLVGKTSIQSVAALMSQLRLFITQDTGILHVACATEVLIIGLFGPTKVHITGPYPLPTRHTIIKRATMNDISPAEVCDTAIEVLREKPVLRHSTTAELRLVG